MNEFIFHDGATRRGNVWGNWVEYCEMLAGLPSGSCPRTVFTKNFTLPLDEMPADGWGMGLGSWASPTFQTGAVTVTIPDNVRVNMLGQIDKGLQVLVEPSLEYGVFNWSSLVGQAWVLSVGMGAKLTNRGSVPMIITPGVHDRSTTVVLAFAMATQGIEPFNTAPFVKVKGQDTVIGSTMLAGYFGGLPDNWVVGGEDGGSIWYQNGIDSSNPSLPNWLGNAPQAFSGARAWNLGLVTVPGTYSDPQPQNMQEAHDRMAAALVGLLSGPIP